MSDAAVPYEPKRPGAWRLAIRDAMREPNEEKLGIFLGEIANNGRFGEALVKAKISDTTVYDRSKKDPDFKAAYDKAKLIYASKVEGEAWNQITGIDETKFDKEGKKYTRKVFPSNPLLQMLLKKVDKGYIDRKEIDVDVTVGGSLVVPRSPKDMTDAEWMATYGKPLPDSGTKVIETKAEERKPRG